MNENLTLILPCFSCLYLLLHPPPPPPIYLFSFPSFSHLSLQSYVHLPSPTPSSSPTGPTTQTDVVKSTAPINQTITFDDFTDSIFVEFTITNDGVAFEPVEMYNVSLAQVGNDSRIMIVSPQVTTINIVDDNSKFFFISKLSLHPYTYKNMHTHKYAHILHAHDQHYLLLMYMYVCHI